MEICKSELLRIISYLEGAARLYDTQPKASAMTRAFLIRRLVKKLRQKL